MSLRQTLSTYERAWLRQDVAAGLTTAVMLVPQAMAYAMLAGLPPIVGLYASTIPLVAYALMGSSRQLAVGPVALDSLLVAAAVAPLAAGDTATHVALAALLAGMTGVVLLSLGVLRAGFLMRFVSAPVTAGFTSAAALVIASSQLGHVMGVPLPRSAQVVEVWEGALSRLPDTHLPTVALALVSVAALVVLKRRAPRFPRFLAVVAAATGAVVLLGLDGQGVATVGHVPAGLPRLSVPAMRAADVWTLLPMAATLAVVGFMEAISVATGLARNHGDTVDPDTELKALGLANLGAALFQGYPVTGGFSRTAVNDQAGARTPVAGLITAAAVAATLMFLTPWFTHLPTAVLAAIILTAVLGLVQVEYARHLWRVSSPDFAVMAITFFGTLVLGIQLGLGVGVLVSLGVFLLAMARPHVAVLGQLPGTTVYRNLDRHPSAVPPGAGVLAVRIDAPLYFANTAFLKQTLSDLETQAAAPLRALVLDAKGIGAIDASAETVLHELVADYEQRGIELWIAGLRGPVADVLRASGLLHRLGPDRLVHRVHEAVDHLTVGDHPRRLGQVRRGR